MKIITVKFSEAQAEAAYLVLEEYQRLVANGKAERIAGTNIMSVDNAQFAIDEALST